jgi:hypothetical protein
MGTEGARGPLFSAKRGSSFPPSMSAGLRAHALRLGGFTRPFSW